jgi:predicted 3-demethylubiquinone-9 3-methyltransferase (glyoxalase superfamily)
MGCKTEDTVQKITTFLTFDGRAEEAVELYTSIFPRSRVVSRTYYGDLGPGPKGSLMSAIFELDGQTFYALNGGSSFSFSLGISLFVSCETQDEIDHYWEKLSEGGETNRCGWLKDRFGVSWQIVPAMMQPLLESSDPARAARAMKAMLGMDKLDIAALQRAADEG